MRFQIKKLLEGYDPADLIEQSMYCFGSDDDGSEDTSDSYDANMGLSDQEVAEATSGSQTTSIDPYDIQQTAQQNMASNIGLATMANADLSPEAMASIGTTGYSPDSVTGFGQQNIGKDFSDFTTADQMTSMSNINNMAKKGMFPDIPTPLGAIINNISKMGANNTINDINMGYTPTYTGGQVTGTTGFGIGMGSPTGAVDGYGIFSNTSPSEMSFGDMNNMGGNESEPIKPATTNPVSGQPVCPDGYRFDDDLQACRIDTSRPSMPSNPNPFPSGDAYYRATSLDQAPMNVPSGFDFNNANQNFISQFAYRPANFTNQMGLSGFTPFRRS
tara:strand:+ start:3262 stop:4254 length:993 start_codon:yes stop_codon:yes gene_type:complete